LYLSEGHSSLFAYCTHELRFSEHEAYHRIEAARAARAFPVILERLREGALTLTTVTLLRPHLIAENADALIADALGKTRREVEQQMASLAPKDDVKTVVRRLPSATPARAESEPPPISGPTMIAPTAVHSSPRSLTAPLASDRYLLRITLSASGHAKLQHARDLLRHVVPDGDPAAIVERALGFLVDDLERRRLGRVNRPRGASSKEAAPRASRHIPAAVRREVWRRDEGRCAFVGRKGRCRKTGGLEFHHVEPFARGGPATLENIELRCRAHNQYEGALIFGPRVENSARAESTRPGPS
jgi:hypothetical protein